MKSHVLHTVWCDISGEAAAEIWHWSLLGVKGLMFQTASGTTMSGSVLLHSAVLWRRFRCGSDTDVTNFALSSSSVGKLGFMLLFLRPLFVSWDSKFFNRRGKRPLSWKSVFWSLGIRGWNQRVRWWRFGVREKFRDANRALQVRRRSVGRLTDVITAKEARAPTLRPAEFGAWHPRVNTCASEWRSRKRLCTWPSGCFCECVSWCERDRLAKERVADWLSD